MPTPQPTTPTAPRRLGDLTAKAVKEALVSDSTVWLYSVSAFRGRKEDGLLAVSRDYLRSAVHRRMTSDPAFKLLNDGERWLETELAKEIEAVLRRHKARSGYAALAGVSRQVWVLPQSEIKLVKGKSVRSEKVEVVDRL